MGRALGNKFKEALFSILPIALIIFAISFVPSLEFTWNNRLLLLGGTAVLIIGIAFFSMGSELSMEPMGDHIGSSLAKTKKIVLIAIIVLVLGFLITIAEPDLSVLASQAADLFSSKLLIVLMVSIGVGVFLVFAVMKIIFKADLTFILLIFYFIIFALLSIVLTNGNGNLIGLSFDSGGVTTGPITVPFLMALGLGFSKTISSKNQKGNSFGLVALCSIGPILIMLLFSIKPSGGAVNLNLDYGFSSDLLKSIVDNLILNAEEVGFALGLVFLTFLIIDFIFIKLSFKKILQIMVGLIYTFIGLVLFLSSAHICFVPLGYKLGGGLAQLNLVYLCIFAVVIGLVTVLAEPAIHVLTHQVEDITTGGISKKEMLIVLAIGNGLAILLSCIRIIFKFSVLYYLVPGYILAIGLSLFVPKIYTSVAFDSGGVASGPLTSSFILPLAIGISVALNGTNTILDFAFGIVALVAMMPLIVIQLLGFKDVVSKSLRKKNRKKRLINADDEQIIVFK